MLFPPPPAQSRIHAITHSRNHAFTQSRNHAIPQFIPLSLVRCPQDGPPGLFLRVIGGLPTRKRSAGLPMMALRGRPEQDSRPRAVGLDAPARKCRAPAFAPPIPPKKALPPSLRLPHSPPSLPPSPPPRSPNPAFTQSRNHAIFIPLSLVRCPQDGPPGLFLRVIGGLPTRKRSAGLPMMALRGRPEQDSRPRAVGLDAPARKCRAPAFAPPIPPKKALPPSLRLPHSPPSLPPSPPPP